VKLADSDLTIPQHAANHQASSDNIYELVVLAMQKICMGLEFSNFWFSNVRLGDGVRGLF
jgi:hypothetical protein